MTEATGQPIRKVFWANLRTGEYKAFRLDSQGQIVREHIPGKLRPQAVTYEGRTPLKWFPAKITRKPGCPPQYEYPAIPPIPSNPRRGRPITLLNVPCDVGTCSRWACWEVADEQELPALDTGDKVYERALPKNVRYYCDFHWTDPTLTKLTGEVIKQEVEARP